MQMQAMRLLRTKTNSLYFFFYSDGKILMKKGEHSCFSVPEVIIEGVSSNFSVCLSPEGEPYVLCISHSGGIYICRETSKLWEKKLLLENTAFQQNTMQFSLFFQKDKIHLIYSMPSEDGKHHYIMSLICRKGVWEKPYKIDSFLPFRQGGFLIHEIEKNHIVLYYKTQDNKVCSREMLMDPIILGTRNVLIPTSMYCMDLSFLTSQNKIHLAYIVKGSFSSQLLYKNKAQNGISQPIVLFEGQRLESCLLFEMQSRLYLFWMAGGQLFYVVSDHQGESFSNPSKYQGNYSKQPIKVEYIGGKEESWVCNEVFLDREMQNEIWILPELDASFYGGRKQGGDEKEKWMPEERETIEKLKNRLYQTEDALKEANNQLMQMTKDLAQRNNEVSSVNAQWRQQGNGMKETISMLEKKYEESLKENRALQKQLEKKEQERKALQTQLEQKEQEQKVLQEQLKKKEQV